MKKVKLVALAVVVTLGGCTTVGNMFSGKGYGEVVDLHDGTLEITAAGNFSGSREDTYQKWDRTASHACGDKPYTTIKREWQSAEYPGILSGVIRCK